LVLILIPLVGLATGIFIGVTLYQKTVLTTSGAIIVSTFGFVIGISAGFYIYKKFLKHFDPVIIKIIKKGSQKGLSDQEAVTGFLFIDKFYGEKA